MASTSNKSKDEGLEFVRRVHQKIQVDPEWCVWDERGFTWWGKNLAQRVWAEPLRKDEEGESYHRLHAQTDIFDGFDGSDEQVQLLNILNHTGTLSALVPSGDGSGRVRLCCSMLLYPDNGATVTFGNFNIGDLDGLSSSTPNGKYTIFGGLATVITNNLGNLGAENAYDLGGGKSAYFTIGSLDLNVVPEPSTYALLVVSAAGLAGYAIRRRRR